MDVLNLQTRIAQRNSFIDITTGAIIPDSLMMQEMYLQNPHRYILPTTLQYVGDVLVPNPDLRGKPVVIEFERVGKNRGYVVSRMNTHNIRFYYHDEQDLKGKIYEKLSEMNENYNPNERYETDSENGALEWWVKSTLDLHLGGHKQGSVGDPSFYFQEQEEQLIFEFEDPTFNSLHVRYDLPCLDDSYKDTDNNRCCWQFLKYKMGYDTEKVEKWIGKKPEENTWTWSDLLKIAEKKRVSLTMFDIHGDVYRKWINREEYETYHYVPDNQANARGMAFMYVNNHIYPYTDAFQKGLLIAIGGNRTSLLGTKKAQIAPRITKQFYDMNTDGQFKKESVLSQFIISNMKDGKKKIQAREIWENRRDYWGDYKILNKWDFKHFKTHRHLFVKESNLDDVMRDIYKNTDTIYQHITDSRGHISKIFSKDHNIWATLNVDDVKPVMERFGLIYDASDIHTVGFQIYNSLHSNNSMSKLKTATLGTIFTVERGFNHTTEWLEEYGDNNTYYKELQDYQMNRNIHKVLGDMQERDFQKRKEMDDSIVGVPACDIDKPVEHGDHQFKELGNVIGLDFNKCYSHGLENPYSPFMKYTEFDNIEDFKPGDKLINGYYYCEIDDDITPEDYLPFAHNKFGWFCWKVVELAKYYNIKFRIIKKYIPSTTIPKDHFKEFVTRVYEECPSQAKFIINAFIGHMCRTAKDKVYTKSKIITDSDTDKAYMDYKGFTLTPFCEPTNSRKGLYLVNEVKTIDKRDGWIPIGKQIVQESKVRLELLKRSILFNTRELQFTNRLNKNTWRHTQTINEEDKLDEQYENYSKKHQIIKEEQLCLPILYKTDSIVIADLGKGDLERAIKNVDIGENRGQVRIQFHVKIDDEDKSPLFNLTNNKFKIVREETKLSTSHKSDTKTYHDRISQCDLIKRRQSFRIDGMAGTGKSHTTCKIMQYLKENNLTYKLTGTTHKASHNSLFESKGEKGQTIDSLLKVSINGLKDPNFNHIKGIDYIIIDECSMLQYSFYKYLQRVRLLYPETNVILIGDYNQLPPVSREYYDVENSNILSWICDYNLVQLTENMRSKGDGPMMFDWYKTILKNGKSKLETSRMWDMKKGFPCTGTHIAYTNSTRQYVNWKMITYYKNKYQLPLLEINNPVHLRCGIWESNGLVHACKIRSNKNTETYYNNQEFYLISKNDDVFIIRDTLTNQNITVEEIDLASDFDYNWCTTIHKSQGSSIDKTYIIHDWEHRGFNANLKYVAVSRTTKLDNIYIMGDYVPSDMGLFQLEYGRTLELL